MHSICIFKIEISFTGSIFQLQSAYAKYVKETYVGSFGVDVKTYDQEYLKDVASTDTSPRLWWFQVCTEVAYFQVAPSEDSIRSSKVDTRHVFSPLTLDVNINIFPIITNYCTPAHAVCSFYQYFPMHCIIWINYCMCRYHLDLCKNVFGEGVYPDVDETNIFYGGTSIAGSKINLLISFFKCGYENIFSLIFSH